MGPILLEERCPVATGLAVPLLDESEQSLHTEASQQRLYKSLHPPHTQHRPSHLAMCPEQPSCQCLACCSKRKPERQGDVAVPACLLPEVSRAWENPHADNSLTKGCKVHVCAAVKNVIQAHVLVTWMPLLRVTRNFTGSALMHSCSTTRTGCSSPSF